MQKSTESVIRKLLNIKCAPGCGAGEFKKAPHKVFLLLILLSQIQLGKRTNKFRLSGAKSQFNELWNDYGWNNNTSVSLPFWHLTGDGIWKLYKGNKPFETKGLKSPRSEAWFKSNNIHGGFTQDVWNVITSSRFTLNDIAVKFIREFIPDLFQKELMTRLRFEDQASLPRTKEINMKKIIRSAEFRSRIIDMYERRCAVCNFGPRFQGAGPVDAAHIVPLQYGGQDTINNGIALCKNHHWALDTGAMAFTDNYEVLVSSAARDGESLDLYLRQYAGKRIRMPIIGNPPSKISIESHRSTIFKSPPINT